jgi:hypothetical protein
MTYSQSSFELTNTSGRRATLWLYKVGHIPIRYHRNIPNEADIKEVTIKKHITDEWFVSFGLETDADDVHLPGKPDVDSLNASNSVGINLGILTTSTQATARPLIGSILKTTPSDSEENSVTYPARIKSQTTTRNSGKRSPRSSVTSSRRCWTTSTNSRRGSSRNTTPCLWKT